MTRTLATLTLLLLASCGGAAEPPPPAPALPPPPRVAEPPPPPADTCGARTMQHLVGRSRTEIPVPVNPARQRVACTGCPITQDYSPERLNFFFDADTGIIREVRCG